MSQRISKAQLASKLRAAGFPEQDIPTMIGIAGGESSFNPGVRNPDASTGDNSYGLFQINMLGGMGPERRAQFGLKSNDELYDIDTNIRAAKSIYDSQGLGAWGAYTNQSYKDFLPTATDLEGADMPQVSTSQPQSTTQGGNVLNVFFDKGSQYQDKKDKSKSLLQSFKDQVMMKALNDVMNPLSGLARGDFDPLGFLK